VISVGDRGEGITPENKGKVFQKFFREGKQSGPGAGLGLAIASGIAEAHGGRLWVEDNTGGGALFKFSLPIDAQAPAEPSEG
jgi:two-component system sensor histidine kinase KdpD